MVELGVPTISFGPPFSEFVDATGKVRPRPPEPKFPGISPTAFDPAGQLQAYSDIMKKEKGGRVLGQELAIRLDRLGPGAGAPTHAAAKAEAAIGDMLPGHA